MASVGCVVKQHLEGLVFSQVLRRRRPQAGVPGLQAGARGESEIPGFCCDFFSIGNPYVGDKQTQESDGSKNVHSCDMAAHRLDLHQRHSASVDTFCTNVTPARRLVLHRCYSARRFVLHQCFSASRVVLHQCFSASRVVLHQCFSRPSVQNESTGGVTLVQNESTGGVKLMQHESTDAESTGGVTLMQNESTRGETSTRSAPMSLRPSTRSAPTFLRASTRSASM